LHSQAQWLSKEIGKPLPEKSPVLAGLLSVIPGLGHVYLEEYGIAVTALAWNGLFGYATWDTFQKGYHGAGTLLAALTLLWYSGTVYGAVSGAERYNRDARLNQLDALDRGAGLDIPFPDPAVAGSVLIGGKF
jgi:hypothetical protein